MNEISLKLPMCPSVNKTHNYGKGKVYLDEKVIQFRKQVEAECYLARVKNIKIKGLIKVKICYVFNNNYKNDKDNRAKCLFDALMHSGIYADDCVIHQEKSIKVVDKSSKQSYILIRLLGEQIPFTSIMANEWINNNEW